MRELLIEKWFPVNEASIESARERAGANMLPPLYFLHLWWARRPLAAARMVSVLTALPADAYQPEDYRKLLYAMGLRGDPIKAAEDRSRGEKGFNYPVFESVNPTPSAYINEAKELWGRLPVGADFMAGGGSIPFEMTRAGYGEVVAGEYNPVAYIILKAGLEYPAKYGERLVQDVGRYGKQVLRELRERVKSYYPPHPKGQPANYIWVKMFRCPECGCEIPALKTLWLDRVNGYAYYPVVDKERVELKIVHVEELDQAGGESRVRVIDGKLKGTIFDTKGFCQGGILECPVHRHTVSAEEVKRQYRESLEAREREGYHGSHPARLAVAVLKGGTFLEPTEEMKKAYAEAEEELKSVWEKISSEDLIPSESIQLGQETERLGPLGLMKFERLFNSRQLLVHAELVRLIRETRLRVVEDEQRKGRSQAEAEEYGNAVATYLTLAFGKTLDYNSILTSWNVPRGIIRDTFDTHAFAWTWDHGEGDMLNDKTGYSWCLNNILKALKGIVERSQGKVKIALGDAAFPSNNIQPTNGFDVIITDPPYYGNVQYAEISDYFYVWFKRVLRDAYPEIFTSIETPKQEEAVANRVRHGSSNLSDIFYKRKMKDIFTSMNRVLRDEGAFVLWFAHKAGAAWSSTINALLDSGFAITALWGVRAEMERSLHISGKASLRTNILMICRKQTGRGGYLQDALNQLQTRLEPRLQELESYGIVGPDFIMGAQAEALRVASQHWPLKDPENRMTPQQMLDFITDQATGIAANYLTRKIAPQIIGVDVPTKFYVLARHLYGDSLLYDDARRLALACFGTTAIGDPVTEIAVNTGLGELATETVSGERAKILELSTPWDRFKKGRINTEKASTIDWIHQAVALLEEGNSVNKAAEAIAQAGGAACDVLSALYQILPDQITQGKRTIPNPEKAHVQTLLLTVCQEGLHLIARTRLREEKAQRRLTDYEATKPTETKYDLILDQFIRSRHTYVEVDTEGVEPKALHEALKERIAARNLTQTIKTYLLEGTVYLEKVRQ